MNLRSTCGFVRLLSVLAVAGGVWGCEGSEQEKEALSVVEDAVSLLENQSVRKTMNLTTRDFLAQPGQLDRNAVSSRLFKFFVAKGDIAVLHPTPDVSVNDTGESALVAMPFAVAKKGTSIKELDDLRDDPDAWVKEASGYTKVQRAEISLVLRNDRWLIQTVRLLGD